MVESDQQARGFAVGKDTCVTVEDEELDEIKLESTHTIDIEKFVLKSSIDDGYRDQGYYIAPENKVGEEAFAVIRDAMKAKKMVGIARRERVMMIEPIGKGLLGTTLHYAYEVRNEGAAFEDIPEMKLPAQMMDLAQAIIDRMSGTFKLEEFKDRYEQAVVELIQSKKAGHPIKKTEAPSRPANVVNLMDALRKSIEGKEPANPSRKSEAHHPKRKKKA